MEKRESTKHSAGAGRGVLLVAAVVALGGFCLLGAPGSAHAQTIDFGSGAHGVFPPVPETGTPSTYQYLLWNMRTGTVRYCNSYTPGTGVDACDGGSEVGVAQIPNIPAGGLVSGVYEFTDFNVSTVYGQHRYVHVVGTSPNTPLTILCQGNITFMGEGGYWARLYVRGWLGPNAIASAPNLSVVGGRGGPGGFDGGASGNGGATPGHGNAGLGPAGGAGGRADATVVADFHAASALASAVNPSLTPLSGGSGGGGGAGVGASHSLGCGANPTGYAGGGGGGGGGGLLLAAAGTVTLSTYGFIEAQGGNGGTGYGSNCWQYGGGGAGGSVRVVANTFTGTGTIAVGGGLRADGSGQASGGFVRVEASINTFAGAITGAAGGSFIAFPTAPVPSNQPTLRITSINSTAAPTSPGASMSVPDITFPTAIETPVTLQVAGSNVPLGTTVNIRVVPATGQPTTATTSGLDGTVADSTAVATVTLPPGAGVVTASATFNVAGSGFGASLGLNALPLIDGQQPKKVEVVAMADGRSRTYLVADSGARFEIGTERP